MAPVAIAIEPLGTESEMSVNRLELQPWCAAATIARITVANTAHETPAIGACPTSPPIDITGTTRVAHTSMVNFRDGPTAMPRRTKWEETHPPPIEPASATR